MRKKVITILSLAVLAVILIFWGGYRLKKALNGKPLFSLSVESNTAIERTPIEINSIRQIGQWEFLSIKTEELVDSIKKGIFFDDRMICIYQGTLSLGIDMQHFEESWITAQGKDSISLSLPPVSLLDQDFINEAQTDAFYESGKWTEKEKEELYQKARNRMLQRANAPENRKMAEQHARKQISRLMHSLGFRHVEISFRETN